MSEEKLNQYKGRLDAAQIAEGINVASRNARRLAVDARVLLKEDRFPTAASLAILSIEESGKVSILRRMAVAESERELKVCWREYRSHTKKNVMGGFAQEFAKGARKLDEFIELFRPDAEHTHLIDQVKQIGFYSDCLGKAHWSEPENVVNESLAKQLVQTAEVLASNRQVSAVEIELWIKHLRPVWNKHPAWMRKALENWYQDMQEQGLAPEGPNEMRQFIRDGITPTEQKK